MDLFNDELNDAKYLKLLIVKSIIYTHKTIFYIQFNVNNFNHIDT